LSSRLNAIGGNYDMESSVLGGVNRLILKYSQANRHAVKCLQADSLRRLMDLLRSVVYTIVSICN